MDEVTSGRVEEVTKTVAEAIADVLGIHVEEIEADESFLDLGFDSISIARLAAKLGEAFDVELFAPQIFEHPSISTLCSYLSTDHGFTRGRSGRSVPTRPFIEPENGRAPRPLSLAQQRLWCLVQFEGGAGRAYNMPATLRLKGTLNREALRAALDRIVERHESLRTRFAMIDGVPVQCICPPRSGFPLRDARLGDCQTPLDQLLKVDACTEFDLEAAPPLRGMLIEVSSEDHVLLVTMHHILTDGWSMGVFFKELTRLYTAFSFDAPDPLMPLRTQYADYAEWQRRWLQGERLERQREFWRQTLEGAPPLLALPTDHPRPDEQEYAGEDVELVFTSSLTARLKAWSQSRGVTLYTTVLTALAALLSKLSGQQEVVIGTTIANRNSTEVEGLIGFFVNTLAIRIDLSGCSGLVELLHRVQQRLRRAQANADIPFDQVVKLLNPERSLSHSPIFQVMFTWLNLPESLQPQLHGLEVQLLRVSTGAAQFDLSVDLREQGGQLVGSMNYATSLFERATIDRYLQRWRELLESIV